jgi:membrane associated rhomboid family serine protease
MFESTPTVKKFFYINLIAFALSLLFTNFILGNFALWSFKGDNFQIWQLITHQFLHGGFLHIIFNMLALLSLGGHVESFLGEKKFIYFYLLSGAFAGIFHILLTSNVSIPMVGASGAIYAIFAFFGLAYPNEKLYAFFIPIGIKAKKLLFGLIGLEVILALLSTGDGIGHWAHIGGAIAGISFYYINKKYLKNIY